MIRGDDPGPLGAWRSPWPLMALWVVVADSEVHCWALERSVRKEARSLVMLDSKVGVERCPPKYLEDEGLVMPTWLSIIRRASGVGRVLEDAMVSCVRECEQTGMNWG